MFLFQDNENNSNFDRASTKVENFCYKIENNLKYFSIIHDIVFYYETENKNCWEYEGDIYFETWQDDLLTIPFKVKVFEKKTYIFVPLPSNLIEKKLRELVVETLDFDEKLKYYTIMKGSK